MERMVKKLSENVSFFDKIGGSPDSSKTRKTQILVGYDRYTDRNGMTQLGETLFETVNMVVIGGVQYTFEHLFGVKGPLDPGYLNDEGVGSKASDVPIGKGVYPDGHKICLFAVGTGGAPENSNVIIDVKYNEKDIKDRIPFRYVDTPLTGTAATIYFGKSQPVGASKISYFMKKFDSVEIKHLWLDSSDPTVDGTPVDNTVFESTRTDGIQSFAEINLTISTTDVKEWFAENGGIEKSRVNSIGLFTGVQNPTDLDFEKIRMFSKLNIPTEPLSLTKELAIIYRVFGA